MLHACIESCLVNIKVNLVSVDEETSKQLIIKYKSIVNDSLNRKNEILMKTNN
jgi:formiminotetrahydrofolate cyclodeaminase